MAVFSCSSSRRLPTIYSLAITLSTFALYPSALAAVPRTDDRGPDPKPHFNVEISVFKHESIGRVYAVETYVGTTHMFLHLDSANYETWVLSTSLPADQYTHIKKYPIIEKPICPASGISFSDSLLVKGDLVHDTIKVGGVRRPIQFIAATEITPLDIIASNSEIAGNLAFSYGGNSWIRSAYKKGLINPIFMLDFSAARPPVATISLKADELSNNDKIKWFPRYVASTDTLKTFWSISVLADPDNPDSPITYMLDSGQGSIFQPLDIVEKYFESPSVGEVTKLQVISGVEYYVHCNHNMPSFELSIGDLKLEISGADLMGLEHSDAPGWCSTLLTGYDPSPDSDNPYKLPYYTIGSPLLENYPVYFDLAGEGRVGFEA